MKIRKLLKIETSTYVHNFLKNQRRTKTDRIEEGWIDIIINVKDDMIGIKKLDQEVALLSYSFLS